MRKQHLDVSNSIKRCNNWTFTSVSAIVVICLFIPTFAIIVEKNPNPRHLRGQKTFFLGDEPVHSKRNPPSFTFELSNNVPRRKASIYSSTRRSLIEVETTELVANVNPAFTLIFLAGNTTTSSSSSSSIFFSNDSLQTITDEVERVFDNCLVFDKSLRTEASDKDLSSAYQSILLKHSDQVFLSSYLSSSSSSSSSFVPLPTNGNVIEKKESSDAIAVTYSTAVTFDITKPNNDGSEWGTIASSSSIQEWLINSFGTCQEAQRMVVKLRDTGKEELNWVRNVEIAVPEDDLTESDTLQVPINNNNNNKNSNSSKKNKNNSPNQKAVIGAIVGCVIAGAITACIILFGKDMFKKKSTKKKPQFKRSQSTGIAKRKMTQFQLEQNQSSDGESMSSSPSTVNNSRKSSKNRPSSKKNHRSDSNHRKRHDPQQQHHQRRHHHQQQQQQQHRSNGSRSSRSSRSSSHNHNGRRRRRKKKKKPVGTQYSMSSISSGSLMTISEDGDMPFFESDEERDSLTHNSDRINEAFKTHQTSTVLTTANVPDEITLNPMALYGKKQQQHEQGNKNNDNSNNKGDTPPVKSYFFRTEMYNQELPSSPNDQMRNKYPRINKSGTFESNSSLGASQYGYDTDSQRYDKERERRQNKNRKQPITAGSDIPPHPRMNQQDLKDNDSDIYSLNKSLNSPRKNHNNDDNKHTSSQKNDARSFLSPFLGGGTKNIKPVDEKEVHPGLSQLQNPNRPVPATSGFRNHKELTIAAPKGKIGVFIINVTRGEPCVVHSVKDDSAIFGKIQIGDVIIKIDGIDVTKWNAVDVSKFLSLRASNTERVLTILRNPANVTTSEIETPSKVPSSPLPSPASKSNSHLQDDTELEASVYSDGGNKLKKRYDQLDKGGLSIKSNDKHSSESEIEINSID